MIMTANQGALTYNQDSRFCWDSLVTGGTPQMQSRLRADRHHPTFISLETFLIFKGGNSNLEHDVIEPHFNPLSTNIPVSLK